MHTNENSNLGQPQSFESALLGLQEIVKKLESGQLPLEAALQKFEEGVRLSRDCQKQLSATEKKVELLVKADSNEGATFKEFKTE